MDYCVADKAGSNDVQINVQLTKLTPLQPLRARRTGRMYHYRCPLRYLRTNITQCMLTVQVYAIIDGKNKPLM